MENTLETLDGLERRLNVAVPVAAIEGEFNKRLQRLARTAKLAGFRPGKVPMKLLAQQYGQQLRSDVISDAVRSGFDDAVRAQNLRIAGTPRIEPRSQAPAATDALEFSAVFEVYPEVTPGDPAQIAIQRPAVEVTATDIERTLEVLRRQRTTYTPAARGAERGDRVRVDFTGTIDGVEFPGGQAKDFPIVLGNGGMLPEFDAALAGMRADEQKAFGLQFPAEYHGREVAGKAAQFVLTVKEVASSQVPELDGEFAQAFGIASGDVADLRREVEANLKLELKHKVAAVVKEQALKGLREQARFELPKALVDAEAKNLRDRTVAKLRQQPGAKPEDLAIGSDVFRPQAEERVALGLLIAELVRRENLRAKPEQVKALVHEQAQTYEQPEAVVRWHYEKPERLAEFEAVVLEQNVVDWIVARARVVDQPASFEQVMGPRAG
jgi:trigger factor